MQICPLLFILTCNTLSQQPPPYPPTPSVSTSALQGSSLGAFQPQHTYGQQGFPSADQTDAAAPHKFVDARKSCTPGFDPTLMVAYKAPAIRTWSRAEASAIREDTRAQRQTKSLVLDFFLRQRSFRSKLLDAGGL